VLDGRSVLRDNNGLKVVKSLFIPPVAASGGCGEGGKEFYHPAEVRSNLTLDMTRRSCAIVDEEVLVLQPTSSIKQTFQQSILMDLSYGGHPNTTEYL
jgi:hypothetical protein